MEAPDVRPGYPAEVVELAKGYGRVLVLGPVGENFGAGMSGGIAYLANSPDLNQKINGELVDVVPLSADDLTWADELIARHRELTGSETKLRAQDLVKIMPRDIQKVLNIIETAHAEGQDPAIKIMEAVS